MEEGKPQEPDVKFAVIAEAADHEKALFLHDLTFARLVDDVLVPYEEKKPFFIDGVPLTREKIKRLKIVRQNQLFKRVFNDLHYRMRQSDPKTQQLYGQQYETRLSAIFREAGQDVTSQVLKAYQERIKVRFADYLPKREEMISAAFRLLMDSLKSLGS